MQPQSDSELIKSVLKGNMYAFNHLINKYKAQVFYLSLKILSVREEAEEVAQDVFVKVYHKLGKFKGESKLSTWIFRITYNECISRIRKGRKHRNVENIEAYDFGFVEKNYQEIDEQARAALLERCLDELDDENRAIVVMFYYHDHSVEEIAEITGLSKTNVKTRLFRARKCLLHFMEKKMKLNKNEWL